MSTLNPIRRPSAASESFITAIAALFFICLTLLFLWLDNRKSGEQKSLQKNNTEQNVSEVMPSLENEKHENASWTENILRDMNGNVQGTQQPPTRNLSVHSVSPPLPLLDIKPQQFTVDAGAGFTFTSQHQSVVSIPTHAFVDKNGNKVTGKVDVKYREFYNYIDIFRSGIPMTFNSGNEEQQLESAGMFELTASKGNEPLYVNPENRIAVMMASMNRNPGYNIYYFDKKTNQWIDKGPSIASTTQGNANTFQLNNSWIDSTEKKFYYRLPEYTIKMIGKWQPGRTKNSLFSSKQQPSRFTFHFVSTQQSTPELNTLRTITWRYTGADSKTLFEKIFNARTGQGVWKNALIAHQEEDDTYLLTLSNDTFTTSIKVIPVLPTEKSVIKFQETISSFLPAQENRITSQKAEFEKFQSDTTDYFTSNPRFIKRTVSQQYSVMRQFEVDGFGTWNCDKPFTVPNAITLNVMFKDENNQTVKPLMVYLVDKSLNTVFSFDLTRMNRFRFNPASQNMVCALFPGDVIAVVRPEEFTKKYSTARNNCVFKVNLNKSGVVTEKELKEQLAFDI
jgi:hypothetical protein